MHAGRSVAMMVAARRPATAPGAAWIEAGGVLFQAEVVSYRALLIRRREI
jgi:hypothetical protein